LRSCFWGPVGAVGKWYSVFRSNFMALLMRIYWPYANSCFCLSFNQILVWFLKLSHSCTCIVIAVLGSLLKLMLCLFTPLSVLIACVQAIETLIDNNRKDIFNYIGLLCLLSLEILPKLV
jgi:hypothetical protein